MTDRPSRRHATPTRRRTVLSRCHTTLSRRRLLTALGLAVVPASLSGCITVDGRWESVDGPTDATLYDVAATATGTVAVGEGGVVLIHDDDGWRVRFEDGPGGTSDALRAIDVTSNGRVAWAAGDSGTLGCYDVVDDHIVDFSAPLEKTSSWAAVGVAGLAGSERISVLNTSGELLRGRRDGTDVEWFDVIEPGTGSSVTALDVTELEYGYVVDTDGGVYESRDAGETWTRIGIEGAAVDFVDVSAIDSGHVSVAGGSGDVYSYDGVGWSRTILGEEPITALVRDRYEALALDAAGTLYERSFSGWEVQSEIDAEVELLAVSLGTARSPQVVVGESGAIYERRY